MQDHCYGGKKIKKKKKINRLTQVIGGFYNG